MQIQQTGRTIAPIVHSIIDHQNGGAGFPRVEKRVEREVVGDAVERDLCHRHDQLPPQQEMTNSDLRRLIQAQRKLMPANSCEIATTRPCFRSRLNMALSLQLIRHRFSKA